jgi:hypothetical protein
MSAIASFYLLDRSAVAGLVQAAKAKPITIPAPTGRWFAAGGIRRRIGWRIPTCTVSPVHNYLQENDLGVSGSYDWSGYVLMDLMSILEDMGTAPGMAEYQAETELVNAVYDLTYLITSADKRHLSALDPARLDRAAAERFFGGEGDDLERARPAIDDGLILLHRVIAALDENEVFVIHIG